MPLVNVRYEGLLRGITKKREESVKFEGKTLGELIAYLITIYGKEFKEQIFHGATLRKDAMILLKRGNTKTVKLEEELKDGDKVAILPVPVEGG